jgi:hypothetical protein
MSSFLIKLILPNMYVPKLICDQYADHKPVKRYVGLFWGHFLSCVLLCEVSLLDGLLFFPMKHIKCVFFVHVCMETYKIFQNDYKIYVYLIYHVNGLYLLTCAHGHLQTNKITQKMERNV